MGIKMEQPTEGVYHIIADTQYLLAATFLRLQEFYESAFSEIKGKYFILEDYMDLYAKEFGNFTYYSDWNGFNIPGNVVKKFYGMFGDLSAKEIYLMELLGDAIESDKKFYVIGTHVETDQQVTIDHELAHAFYYLDHKYKKDMLDLTNLLNQDESDKIHSALLKLGYCNEVLDDELQAYLSTSSMTYIADHFGSVGYWDMVLKFQRMFEKYKKEKLNETG